MSADKRENIENTTDPTCSGTVIVHWDAYLPDNETLIDGNGDDRLKDFVLEAIEEWTTLYLDPRKEGTRIRTLVLDESDVHVDDDNRGETPSEATL